MEDIKTYLNEWYNNIHDKNVDLVNEFGGSELFLIEGDCLLFDFLYDGERHLLDFNEPFVGGQFLALIFLIESFMDRLKQRGCKFHIVFFEAQKEIWNFDPKFRIAREIVFSHLKSYQNVTKIPFFNFDNWESSEFTEYLKERRPLFILLGDGTTENFNIDFDSDVQIPGEKSIRLASIIWKGLIFDTLHNDLSVALIQGMEFKDSHVKAFAFDRGNTVDLASLSKQDDIKSLCKNIIEKLNNNVDDDEKLKYILSDKDKDLLNSEENQKIWLNGGKRIALIIIPLIGLLRNNSNYWFLAKIFLLHVYLLDNIKLKSRTLSPISSESKNIGIRFLSDFFTYCSHALQFDTPLSYDSKLPLLPVNPKFFSDYLEDLQLELVDDESKINKGIYGSTVSTPFKYILPWLTSNRGDDEQRSVEYREKHATSYKTRGYQKYVSFMNRYVESLEGTQGFFKKAIQSKKEIQSEGDKGDKKQITQKISNRQKEIKEQILQDKSKKIHEESEEFLDKVIVNELPRHSTIEGKLTYLDSILSSEKNKLKHPLSIVRGQFLKLQILLEHWSKLCQRSELSQGWQKFAVNIYRQENESLSTVTNQENSKPKGGKVKKGTKKAKQTKLTNSVDAKMPSLEFEFEMPRSSSNLKLPEDITDSRFQMLYAGHLMDRNTQSVDDPRVEKFKPDMWQCKVLDVIDRDESALVSCPTSSGVLVYVAPSKALVNQVTAEIYGRFNKTYDKPGSTSWGIYTMDYCVNEEKCQILVTVPDILEILLLSPDKVKWVSRIRRIIFDEIHCIGEDRHGTVWEHLILLANVPILALSATVGNPDEFRNWIAKAQKPREMRLIRSTKRFSDLVQYAYVPQYPLGSISTVLPKECKNSLIPIHLFSALSSVIVAESGIPVDFKLTPDQCVQLWDMMNKVSNSDPDIQFLDPDVYFKEKGYIVKDDVDRYEVELKKKFVGWVRDQSKSAYAKEVISKLDTLKDRFVQLENSTKNDNLEAYSFEFLEKSIIHLLTELSAQDKLPVIIFHLDREGSAQEKQEKKKKNVRDPKKRPKNDDDKDEPPEDDSFVPIFDWEAQDPDFSFVNPRFRMETDKYEKMKQEIRAKLPEELYWLLDALDRGIGVHHAGVNKRYREAVEILLRRRHLTVVIATETLALGINMPARSVVFAGDFVSLNALQFRQMSGRSGRRNFDNIGHVIFFGIPQAKIKGLLTSAVPNLTGNFHLTNTLVLRCIMLLSQEEEAAKKSVSGLFGDSFFYLGKERLSGQIKYHLRYSIEYLTRENLIDFDCNPITLSGFVCNLYSTEPGNFALATLFKRGILHKICSMTENKEETLVLILAYLFNRIKLRNCNRNRKIYDKHDPRIYLDPLPEKVKSILDKHNERILEVYTEYIVSFAKQNYSKIGPDNVLPISKLEFPPKKDSQENSLLSKLDSLSIPFYARSPFIAMCSSLGDKFYDVYDLVNHIHSQIFLDSNSIPYIPILEKRINAYILNFYERGNRDILVSENRIESDDVWPLLREFQMALHTIVAILDKRNIASERSVLTIFESVKEHFDERFQKTWA
ncbi:1777_t:CDS:10 [Diversispora eburnea]|uniref:1777_t:CDS:1 n=1 Tax=Diversispora eburnea TaxID=1213867 RepID=A0A9N8V3C9_9GLOM|nr:1777_t:CDS:10 [Diversispora eburnea]